MDRNYRELLEAQWEAGKFLCVGLDTDFEKMPEHLKGSLGESIVNFNRAIIDATKDIVGAYKPNTAFYEAYGDVGVDALKQTVSYILEQAPEIPVILDAKRADIGNTNNGYVHFAFDHIQADAITVHPYLGSEALEPFLAREEKGVIVLCRTSNLGAGEVQDLIVDGQPLYISVAQCVAKKWNARGNCSVVVGATYPEELKKVRAEIGDMPILIPGIGAQGGDIEKTVLAGRDSRGAGMVIAASRAVIYASSGADFADAARRSAQELDSAIRAARLK